MPEHIRNILIGIGSVFVCVPPEAGYRRVERGGFARDRHNLAADRRAIVSDIGRVTRRVSSGKK